MRQVYPRYSSVIMEDNTAQRSLRSLVFSGRLSTKLPLHIIPKAMHTAQLFLGHKIATNIPCVPFGMAALVHRTESPEHVRQFNPKDGDVCYVHIDPNINVWYKGTVLRKVIGVPDSYVIDVDGHQYRRNKRDLTLVSPSTSHQDDQEQPMRATVRPTLHLRQTLKFPRLPVQATEQKDFIL